MNGEVLNGFIDFVIETQQFLLNEDQTREFVTDFITTISNDSNDNFGIRLNDVAKWLSVREKNLRNRLYNDYVEDVDYKIFSGDWTETQIRNICYYKLFQKSVYDITIPTRKNDKAIFYSYRRRIS